jgi:hypothetical protein
MRRKRVLSLWICVLTDMRGMCMCVRVYICMRTPLHTHITTCIHGHIHTYMCMCIVTSKTWWWQEADILTAMQQDAVRADQSLADVRAQIREEAALLAR